MIPSRKNIFTLLILISLTFSILFNQEEKKIVDPWKYDLQILLGFSDDQIDGEMGEATFLALKKFAITHDLSDVVLRGDYEDLGFWGFQQYLLKYHQYWIRELKNHQIIDDVLDKEYLRQADETLYSFEMAILNAQSEVDRLTRAKSRAKRLAHEKQELDKWGMEKREAERIISALKENILVAEEEAEKWSIERIRAKRLAAEKEQLQRLEERKADAILLTSELVDVIALAKMEVDRIVKENEKLKALIEASAETGSLAEQIRIELKTTRAQLDSLSDQKDSLEIKLQELELQVQEKSPPKKKKRWYRWVWPFGK